MNRPPEIPEDIWSVLTVGIAGKALLLPPSFEWATVHAQLVSVAFDEDSPTARLLRMRCEDQGGKFSKGMRCTMEKSLEKARKLLGLNKRKPRRQTGIRGLRATLVAVDEAMDALNASLEAAKAEDG